MKNYRNSTNFIIIFLVCLSLYSSRYIFKYSNAGYVSLLSLILLLLFVVSIKKLFGDKKRALAFATVSVLITVYSIGYNPFSIKGAVLGNSQPWSYALVQQKEYDTGTVDIVFFDGTEVMKQLDYDCDNNSSLDISKLQNRVYLNLKFPFHFIKKWETNSFSKYDTILCQENSPLYYKSNEFVIEIVPAIEYTVQNKLKEVGKDSLQAGIFLNARKSIVNNINKDSVTLGDENLKVMFEKLLDTQYKEYKDFIREYKKKNSEAYALKVRNIRKSLVCYLSTLQLYESFYSKSSYIEEDLKQQMLALQLFTSLQIISKETNFIQQYNLVVYDFFTQQSLGKFYFSTQEWLNGEVGSAIDMIFYYDLLYNLNLTTVFQNRISANENTFSNLIFFDENIKELTDMIDNDIQNSAAFIDLSQELIIMGTLRGINMTKSIDVIKEKQTSWKGDILKSVTENH